MFMKSANFCGFCQPNLMAAISQRKLISRLFSSTSSRTANIRSFGRNRAEIVDNHLADPDLATRALRAAIIGCPNVGKSALTNALVRSPVCAVSKLVDTTRANTTAALTEDQCQLVVVDSPGLISRSHAHETIGTHSEDRILTDPEKAIERAEQIIVVQDATMTGEYLQHRILYLLHRYSHIPACLVLNKIDLVQRGYLIRLAQILTEGQVDGQKIQMEPVRMGILGKIVEKARKERTEQQQKAEMENEGENENAEANSGGADQALGLRPGSTKLERDAKWHALYNKLLHMPAHKASWTDTRRLFQNQAGWPHFKAIFYVSAKTGEGIDALRDHLRKNAVARKWRFAPEMVSEKDPRQLCAEHVRSTLLDSLPGDMAYRLRVGVTEWEQTEDVQNSALRIAVNVFCEKPREARQIWYKLEDLETRLSNHLGQLFSQTVHFRLLIRVKDVKGVYQPDAKAEEWRQKRKAREEARKHGGGDKKKKKLPQKEEMDEEMDEDDFC